MTVATYLAAVNGIGAPLIVVFVANCDLSAYSLASARPNPRTMLSCRRFHCATMRFLGSTLNHRGLPLVHKHLAPRMRTLTDHYAQGLLQSADVGNEAI